MGPDRARFLLGGLLGFTLYQLGFVLGLDRTSALSSTLLLATIPLFSLLFLRLGGVERVRSRQWAGVVLAIVGVGLLVLAKGDAPRLADARLGDGLSLGAAASFALYGIVTRPLGDRYPASTVLAGSLLIGSLPLIPLALLESPPQRWAAIAPSGWAIWLYSVVVPVYLGYTWWTAALTARGVAAIAPYVLLVPLVGGAIAVAGLGEPLTPWLALGSRSSCSASRSGATGFLTCRARAGESISARLTCHGAPRTLAPRPWRCSPRHEPAAGHAPSTTA